MSNKKKEVLNTENDINSTNTADIIQFLEKLTIEDDQISLVFIQFFYKFNFHNY